MIKQLMRFKWLLAFAATACMLACTEEENIDTGEVENYVDEVVFDMQERGNCGKFGCYEYVFPVTIAFADETSLEVNDYTELRDAISAWREANPDAETKPTLAFPLEVTTDEGEVISVASADELRALRVACRRAFFRGHGPKGHRHRGHFCFSLNFPVTLALPDDTTVEVADRMELKQTVRSWKADNPDSDERPELVFPIDVTMEDETVVTVDSKEALMELKDSCGG